MPKSQFVARCVLQVIAYPIILSGQIQSFQLFLNCCLHATLYLYLMTKGHKQKAGMTSRTFMINLSVKTEKLSLIFYVI